MHSKSKLLLAIITSPGAAFEEIIQRRLLGTAFALGAAVGAVSMIGAFARVYAVGPAQYFALGKDNPLTWLGLYMLYALAMQRLLRWVGSDIEYSTVLLILGWSHVLLLLHQIAATVWSTTIALGGGNRILLQLLDALRLGLPLWYLLVVGIGVQIASRAPLSRGIMAYFVVAAAATIALDYTYGKARIAPFEHGLPGLAMTAFRLTPMYPDPWLTAPDQLPKLAAAVIGLVLGLWHLAKSLGWTLDTRNRRVASVAAVGLVCFGIYTFAIYKTDYYGKLLSAQQLYDLAKFHQAAAKMESLLPIIKDNASLMLDLADTYYVADEPNKSIQTYNKLLTLIKKARLGKDEYKTIARPYTGIGAAYDLQGKYDQALRYFKLSVKAWPEFRDPWVRMAITYNRIGDYRKAIESGDYATKKLGSKAAVVYVALAQAYAQTKDIKRAETAVKKLHLLNKSLAKKIGDKPQDWKNAVAKLSPQDLKYPLERQPAPAPKQTQRNRAKK
jgi:tetratricopeptide (TPR) repeat protein